MKTFEIRVFGEKRQLRAIRGCYPNGNTSIELLEDNGSYEERWAVLTVNPGVKDPPYGVWIKTWSENKETYDELAKHGYLKPTAYTTQCGYSEAVACIITDKLKPFLKYS